MTKQQARAPIHKIVKAQTQEALDAGATHAQFHNKSLNKRLMKNKEKVAREQQRRENRYNAQAKARQRILDSMRARVRDELPQDVGPRGTGLLVDTENRPLPDHQFITKEELEKGLDQLQANSSAHMLVVDSLGSLTVDGHPAEVDGYGLVPKVDVKLVDNPSVGEDGIVISPLPLSEPKAADLGEPGKYPLNLYGDKENYKPFPAIGDYVREDGLLSALRDNELPMTSVVDPVRDELLYAEPGSVVTEETAKLLPVFIDGKFAPAVLEGYAKGLAAVRARATDGGGDEMVPANINEVIRRGGIADAPAAISDTVTREQILNADANKLYPELTNVMSLNPFEGCVTRSRKQMFSSMLNKHGDGVRPEGAVVETGIEAAGSDEAPDTRFALPEPTAESTLEEELKRSGYISGGGLSDGYIERD